MADLEFGSTTKAHIQYRLANGTRVPGVTTILGVISKPAIKYWANDLGLQGHDIRKYVDKAARIGTLIHYMVECDLKGEDPDLSQYSPDEVDRAANGFLKYLRYRDEHALRPILVEKPLVSEKHRFGGTVDFYGEVDDWLALVDIKSSGGVYPDHFTQVVAYAHLLLEHGYESERIRILRIGRDESEGFDMHTIGEAEAKIYWRIFRLARRMYEEKKAVKWR